MFLLSCADTVTDLGREATARPRIEQLALSNAIDLAFRDVDFAEIIGKRVFIETQALSKLDIEFINAYISGLSIENNAIVVNSIRNGSSFSRNTDLFNFCRSNEIIFVTSGVEIKKAPLSIALFERSIVSFMFL